MSKLIKKHKVLIIAILIICLVIWLSFSSEKKPTIYVTSTVDIGDVRQNVFAIGEITAAQLVTVGTQASGQIKKIHVQIGQQVKQGELIAEIDATTQLNDLATNKALLKNYVAQQISRNESLKIAQQQYEREFKLKSRDATSDENVENAANILSKAKADLKEMETLIDRAQIAVNTSEANLGYTRITAPIDGTVISMPVEEGQTVNASQQTPTIVQLADLSRMKNKIKISEGDVTVVSAGMPVSFNILSDSLTEYKVPLFSIYPASTILTNEGQDNTDRTSNSGQATYYYGLLFVDNFNGKLRIGMTTKNTIQVASEEDTIRVPVDSVYSRDNQYYVRILEDGRRPVERKVEIGLSDSMYTAVNSGLNSGDIVITAQFENTAP